jgi:MoaA/NifB/PqqE/SkfB family radical SAM enzyme
MATLRTGLGLLCSVAASNVVRLRHPLKVSLAVTWRCNLRCRMCNIWRRDPGGDELTAAEVDDFFRRADGFRWVGFTGGEPFLRADLPELVDAAVARCRGLDAVHANTNGQLREPVVALLEHARRRHPRVAAVLTVSVDGPPAVHDAIRGRDGAWRRAVETFAAAKGVAGAKVQVGYTVSAHNLGRFAETWEALRAAWPALAPDDLNVNVFQTSGHYYGNEGMAAPEPGALAREIDAILALDRGGLSVNNFLRRRYLRLYRRFLATRASPLRCQALSATCFVDAGGELYPCIVYRRGLGSVRALPADFRSWWRSAPVRALQRDCAGGRCPGCWSPCDAFSAIGGSLVRAALA